MAVLEHNITINHRLMHPTALHNATAFFSTYAPQLPVPAAHVKVVEIGSQNVNGSIRDACPPAFNYCGLDFVAGNGVDMVINDPYQLPLPSASVDIVVSNSCLEHSEFFWLVFMEMLRLLKPHGLLYLNMPSNGPVHRFPVDCWRFYPDSGHALAHWGQRNGVPVALLESFISYQDGGIWNDCVAIFVKNETEARHYPNNISQTSNHAYNVWRYGHPEPLQFQEQTEDQRRVHQIRNVLRTHDASGQPLNEHLQLQLIREIANNPRPVKFVKTVELKNF